MVSSSSIRKWTARFLLALIALWAFGWSERLLSGRRSVADALDISNPSPAGIIAVISLILYFVVRPRKNRSSVSPSDADQGLPHSPTRSVQYELAADESAPKGICPNCAKTISLSSLECGYCHANFGDGSVWKIKPT